MTVDDAQVVATTACSYCHAHPGERCESVAEFPGHVLEYVHTARREAYQIRRSQQAAWRREHAA